MRRHQARVAAGITSSLLLALVSTSALAQTKTVRFLHNETDPPSIEFKQGHQGIEAANPDIKIEMEAVSTDGRLQKVLASINTKTMPEVFNSFLRRDLNSPARDISYPSTTSSPRSAQRIMFRDPSFLSRARPTIFPTPSAITVCCGSGRPAESEGPRDTKELG